MKKPAPSKDEFGARRSYLELYAARDHRKRLSRINTELGINQRTVNRWFADPDFVAELRDIDRRRMELGISFVHTLWPRALEEAAAIACGEPEEPPNVEGLDPLKIRFLMAAYTARAAQRTKLSIRACELLAKIVGAIAQTPAVQVYASDVQAFNQIPSDPDALIENTNRLVEVLERAKAHRSHLGAGNGGGGNGKGEDG